MEHKPEDHTPEPAVHKPNFIGRGAAVGYTEAYQEPSDVDIQEVVALQTARGPE